MAASKPPREEPINWAVKRDPAWASFMFQRAESAGKMGPRIVVQMPMRMKLRYKRNKPGRVRDDVFNVFHRRKIPDGTRRCSQNA